MSHGRGVESVAGVRLLRRSASRLPIERLGFEHAADPGAQIRQDLVLEPGIVAQPTDRVPTRMGQYEILREKVAPTRDGLGYGAPSRVGQVIINGVTADEQSQLDSRKGRAQRHVPARCALAARWQVAAPGISAGITQTDRHYRNATLVVESLPIESEP